MTQRIALSLCHSPVDLLRSRTVVHSSFAPKILAVITLLMALLPCRRLVAQERPTLSGTWSASAMNVQYAVGEWGDKCGPRPSGGGPGGGTVTIVQQGNELSISGAGGSYSTTNCFEQGSGLRRVSHSASPRGWSNRCTTAANDPRQAVIVTTMAATDTSISFNETGTYQFVLEGQNCTASVRRTRSFSLIQRQGESAPPTTQTATPSAAPTPTPTSTSAPPPTTIKEKEPPPPPPSCNEVGDPARIEVRPARKLMRPGEEFTFQTRVVDAKGCRVDAHPTWSVSTAGSKVTVDATGTVRVPSDATEGTTDVVVSLSGQHVPVKVEVASAERYDALLAAGGLNAKGEAEEAAIGMIATGSLGGGRSISEDNARRRKFVFLGLVSSLAAMLAITGFVLLRRGQKKRAALREKEEAEEAEAAREDEANREARRQKRRAQAEAAEAAARQAKMFCPVCQREYPPAGTYCPVDGTQLVRGASEVRGPAGGICPTCSRGFEPSVKVCPEHGELLVPAALYNATAAKRPAAEPKGKICPTCGSRYGGEAGFCGKDGTALVMVN